MPTSLPGGRTVGNRIPCTAVPGASLVCVAADGQTMRVHLYTPWVQFALCLACSTWHRSVCVCLYICVCVCADANAAQAAATDPNSPAAKHHSDATRDHAAAKAEAQRLEKAIDKRRKQLSTADQGGECEACGQPVDREHVMKHLTELEVRIPCNVALGLSPRIAFPQARLGVLAWHCQRSGLWCYIASALHASPAS